MVSGQVVAAARRDDVESVASFGPHLARRDARAVKIVVGVVHPIDTEDGFQAALVKRLVVRHQRQPLNERLYPFPYVRENGGRIGICLTQSVNIAAPVGVILRLGLDERVESFYRLASAHDNHTDRTHRRPVVVGGLKIYRCEIFHIFCLGLWGYLLYLI